MKRTLLSVVLSTLLFSTGTAFANVPSIQALESKVKQGDVTAQTNLAIIYLYGEGVQVDEKKAFELFKKSAEKGDAIAQYYVGIAYRDAIGTEKNIKLAVEWLEKAAEQNDIDAQYRLALIYQEGSVVKKDPNKAFTWMFKAAQHEIDADDFDPEYYLAKMYKKGEGTTIDLNQAFQWMSKAAKRKNISAEYELALMYEKGEGTAQNLEKAIDLYQRAASSIFEAKKRLGDIYFDLAQKTSGEQAHSYYEKAVDKGNGNAARIMAKKYAQADGVAHNKKKALQFYQIFFASPDSKVNPMQPEFISEAMYWVDRLEAFPDDGEANYFAAKKSYNDMFKLYEPYIPYDPDKVKELYKRAAELGHAGGQYEWANIIRENDPDQAFKLTLSAAEKGHVNAQRSIAYYYTQGNKYVKKDLEKAKEWYLKTQGDHKDVGDAIAAKYALSEYERLGGKDKISNDDLDANYNLANNQYYSLFNGYPAAKYSEISDIKTSIASYLALAEKGHSEAQVKVAALYLLLDDYAAAINWYKKALTDYGKVKYKTKAEPEEFLAQTKYELAQVYENSPKEFQNFSDALKLYNESATTYWKAQYHLAMIYEKGLLGQAINHQKALYWHIKHVENKTRNIYTADSAKRVADAIKNKETFIDLDGIKRVLINDPKTRVSLLHSANDLESYLELAQAYEKGIGRAIDYENALMYYRFAANKNKEDPRAYFHLGRLFSKELGIKTEVYDREHVSYKGKDDEIAFYYYKKAADLGHLASQYMVGRKYDLGEGVKKDLSKAIEWYTKAADQGQRRAQYHLALKYEKGEGVKQDLNRAITLYHQAADQGLDSAQYTLAVKYDKGDGLEKNSQKAFDLYTKAAQQGHIESQYNLGVKYDTGNGVERNVKQAATWYAKAAEQGYADAQYNLALMYDKGQGVTQDQELALKWYAKAAQQGQAAAQNHFGVLHDTKGGSLNDMIAVNWYKLAAEQGYSDAQYNLAVMYEDGQGVDQSYSKAFIWYEKAAKNQHPFAQYNLAWMYEQGQGVKQSYKKAAELYEAVAKQGHPQAQVALERVKKHLTFGFL